MEQRYYYLTAAVIFLVISIILFLVDFFLKRKKTTVSSTLQVKDKGVWGFTKAHILQYSAIFCLVMCIGSFFGFLL
ncbi:hypothetical protein SLITO_v1c00790 [Spiroplasma litorale]|uniref:Uncharacterized protein n=1 Tax=Spiroplasma litorale TaxID=216942 RepID=A0A0K1W0W6_9MOLU|nr:hypothetical protein SLITO_v1c00790 [Spiroplasma litorale]